MRAPIAEDANNVDRIGSASNPGLRSNMLTRAQHHNHLAGQYRGGPRALGTPDDLEKLLDSIHGPESPTTTEPPFNERG